ncbi:YtxH domain-containing protein [Thalassiella azotivora]
MKGKGGLLLGLAAGYVLGTRAGRQQYEQMRSWAKGKWNDPAVQEKVHEAADSVKQKAPEVQHKLADAGRQAVSSAKDSVSGGSGSSGDDVTPTQPSGATGADPMQQRVEGYRDQKGA